MCNKEQMPHDLPIIHSDLHVISIPSSYTKTVHGLNDSNDLPRGWDFEKISWTYEK